VSDADLVAASDEGSSVVNSSSTFQSVVQDLTIRADAAGIDLENLSDTQKSALRSILGYTDSEWSTVLSTVSTELSAVTEEAPELTWDSYYEKSQEVTGGGSGDDDHIYYPESGGPIVSGLAASGIADADGCLEGDMAIAAWGWPSSSCLKSAGWFGIATFGTAVAASSCGAGNVLGCASMLGGAAAMVRTGSDMMRACRAE
jgi:hypothetical protein